MYSRRCLTIALLCSACSEAPAPDLGTISCTAGSQVAALPPAIREASGIAISRRDSTLLWIINDSEGSPLLYALGTDGSLRAEVAMPAAPDQSDWEDLAAGPCPLGDCLYIADIGDNFHQSSNRAILRIPEPRPDSAGTGPVERFAFQFPAGPEDAEALFIMPDTSAYIVTKGRRGPVAVFRYPKPWRPDETVTLQEIARLSDGLRQIPDLVTGAAATPDGRLIVIRTYSRLQFYTLQDNVLHPAAPDSGLDITHLREPQGEGVTISPTGTIYLASESGLDPRRPPLSTLTCH